MTRPKLTPLTLVEAQSHFALYAVWPTCLWWHLPGQLHVMLTCQCVYRTHIIRRWCVTSSPLLLGMPLTNDSAVGTPAWSAMMAIVTNNESIAVNQLVRKP